MFTSWSLFIQIAIRNRKGNASAHPVRTCSEESNRAHPLLPYFFAHIRTIEILALALALVVHSQAHSGFATPPFLLSPPRGIRPFWTVFSQRGTVVPCRAWFHPRGKRRPCYQHVQCGRAFHGQTPSDLKEPPAIRRETLSIALIEIQSNGLTGPDRNSWSLILPNGLCSRGNSAVTKAANSMLFW